jgi:hypothetical protein
MSEEVSEVCPICKAEVAWSDWSKAKIDELLVRDKAEIRMGRCRCSGKTYIQTRPGREATEPGKTR